MKPVRRAPLALCLFAAGCCAVLPDPPEDKPPPPQATATSPAPPPATAAASAAPVPEREVSTDVPCGDDGPAAWPLKDPALGQWGEDLRAAPDFGYTQERRAPKMPDGDTYFARTPARVVDRMENALLICHIEVYTKDGDRPAFYRYKLGSPNSARPHCNFDWDTFAPPDVLLKFRLRSEHPIALYAPEDHWGFFISVPRLRLAKGDLLEVKLWDRDSAGDSAGANEEDVEYIGYAKQELTGKWPIRLSGPYFTMKCNAMTQGEAESSVKSWLAPLDDKLRRLEAWQPDPKKWNFGEERSSYDDGKFSFGSGNFRYVAGFLGWDHPWVMERRAKLDEIDRVVWPRKRAEAAKRLVEQAAPPGKSMPLGGAHGALRVTGVVCASDGCTLAVELSGGRASPQTKDWKVELASIDEAGVFRAVGMSPVGDVPPDGGAPGAARSYEIRMEPAAPVLWIQAPAGVYTVKARDVK